MVLSRTQKFPADWEKNYKGTVEAAFSNIVKPEKRESWNAKISQWFVLDQTAESKRKPGNFFFTVFFVYLKLRTSQAGIRFNERELLRSRAEILFFDGI